MIQKKERQSWEATVNLSKLEASTQFKRDRRGAEYSYVVLIKSLTKESTNMFLSLFLWLVQVAGKAKKH
jgi:hypothetical protein